MEKIKNNIILKFIIGLLLLTLLVLSIQTMVFELSDTIETELTKTLLILSATIIPLIGLYLVTKISCKKVQNAKLKWLLTKVFIISLVLIIFAVIYIGYKLNMFGNIENGIRVYSDGKETLLSAKELEKIEEYAKSFLIVTNIKSIIKALIISTLYTGALVLILVRIWINKNLEIEKEELHKQIKQLIVIIVLIIMIESLINIGINIKEGNIQIPINVVLENKITNAEKNQIETKLKGMNEIINYDTDYGHEIIEEYLGDILEGLQTDISDFPECYRIIIHYKDKENVKKQLEELQGIKSINFGL